MQWWHDLMTLFRDINFIFDALFVPILIYIYNQWRDNKKRKIEAEKWKQQIQEQVEELAQLTQKTNEYRQAIKIVLRGTLKQKAALYIERGVISSSELDAFHTEFEVYKELGGNGVAQALAYQVDNLRVDDNGLSIHDAKMNQIEDIIRHIEHNQQLVKELRKVLKIDGSEQSL